MPTIAVLADEHNGPHPEPSIRAVEASGGKVHVIAPGAGAGAIAGIGGLLVPDSNDPQAAELLHAVLAVDMPVFATGYGMHLLNTCFGGRPAEIVNGHQEGDDDASARHQIYLSPGSKMAAIIGSAGMFRVNSRHRLGLREPQRAERLMTIAYQLDDGVIEGLESKEHSWVIGVQCLPERGDEVPASFGNLFLGLVERADAFTTGRIR